MQSHSSISCSTPVYRSSSTLPVTSVPSDTKRGSKYYSSPDSVRVIIYDPSGHKVFDKQDKVSWHPLDDKEHPAAHYPNHTVVSFDGIVDIFEQRKAEPFEYLSDDKTLWDALKPGT